MLISDTKSHSVILSDSQHMTQIPVQSTYLRSKESDSLQSLLGFWLEVLVSVVNFSKFVFHAIYRGADKSLARPGGKKATATKL